MPLNSKLYHPWYAEYQIPHEEPEAQVVLVRVRLCLLYQGNHISLEAQDYVQNLENIKLLKARVAMQERTLAFQLVKLAARLDHQVQWPYTYSDDLPL